MLLGLMILKIFDLHCDTLSKAFDDNCDLNDNSLAVNYGDIAAFETFIESFAVFLYPNIADKNKRYNKVLCYGKQCLYRSGFQIVTTKEQLDGGGQKALLSVEGFVPFDIERLYYDGIRTVSLCWNYDNIFAGGALGDGRLTKLGKSAVLSLNQHRMVTDLSHLNRQSFFDVIDIADFAVATHTGIDKLVPNKRNLTDRQLTMIKEKGGLVGLTVYPEFIGQNVFEGFYQAVVHCLALGLQDNICIGTDFDGAKMISRLSKSKQLSALYGFLLKRKLTKPLVDKIFFENSFKFYHNVLTKR